MKAHELARQLLLMPDIDVQFAYNYGDHWKTIVTEDVEKVRTKEVMHSVYFDMDRLVTDDDFDTDAETRQVVVLS